MSISDRDTLLARRIHRLPTGYRTVILQLLNKCETLHREDFIAKHIQNANNLVNSSRIDEGYQKLPQVKTRYYFIDKQTRHKLTIEQVARLFNKSTKTIYFWVYRKYHLLLDNFEVIRE